MSEDLTETKENHVYTGDDMSQANWEELRDTTENHNDTNSHVGEATEIGDIGQQSTRPMRVTEDPVQTNKMLERSILGFRQVRRRIVADTGCELSMVELTPARSKYEEVGAFAQREENARCLSLDEPRSWLWLTFLFRGAR
jgi:hypothetical protein